MVSRTTFLLLAKGAVAAGLIALLLWQADWREVWQSAVRTGPVLIGVALFAQFLSVPLSAWKWRMLLELHGVSFRFGFLLRTYFIALFFNNFLPSSIGGDGYRIYKTWGNDRSKSTAVIAVVMERLTGLVAMLAIGWLAAIVVYSQRQDVFSGAVSVVGAALFLVGGVILWLGWSQGWLERWAASGRCPAKLRIVFEHLGEYRIYWSTTLKVMVVSFIFQLHNSIAFFVLLKFGMSVDITIAELLVISLVTNLVAVLPISINGIGVMEGGFVFVARMYDVPFESALATMLISRVLVMALSLIGAVLYVTATDRGGSRGPAQEKREGVTTT